MTPEEARKEFNKFVSAKTSMRPVFVDVVNDALEKQVPQKLINGCCLICGCFISKADAGYEVPYCKDCGQALSWEDE